MSARLTRKELVYRELRRERPDYFQWWPRDERMEWVRKQLMMAELTVSMMEADGTADIHEKYYDWEWQSLPF